MDTKFNNFKDDFIRFAQVEAAELDFCGFVGPAVALLVGAWIETWISINDFDVIASRSLWARGLKPI